MIVPIIRSSAKRLKQLERNENGTAYREWREDVLNRDGHTCQYPRCPNSMDLQIHHIKKWSKHRYLRYNIANGLTLCRECHQKKVNGREARFEFVFLQRVFFLSALHKKACQDYECRICKKMGYKKEPPAPILKKKRGRPRKSPESSE